MQPTLTDRQRRTVETLEWRLEHIALLPAVVTRLAALDLDLPGASDEIVGLVCSDPPLALRLIHLANSGSGEGKIDTIHGAVRRVGTHGLVQLILSLSVVEVFVPHTRGQRNLWIHSIQTALAARRLAVMRPDLGLGAEECFLAGLLHDIGRFLIFEYWPQEMAQIDEADVTNPQELIATEHSVCGFDHAALGHMVCRRWHLPESVCQMVKAHHMYADARRWVPPEVEGLVRLVQEADCFSFGLLRNPTLPLQTDVERNSSIDASLRMLATSERVLPTAKLAEQAVNIDREARIASAGINIAYSQ